MRLVLGIAAGIAGWFVIVTVVGFVLRAFAPAVAADLNVHATAGALAARLAISFAGSLFGGWLAAALARTPRAALIAGVVLLLGWGSYHVTMIWHQFPVWYHLTFFASLVLFSVLGGRLVQPVRRIRPA